MIFFNFCFIANTQILIDSNYGLGMYMLYIRVVKKTQFFSYQFTNLGKATKAVACTMIFNTASTMKNLPLNSQNRLFSCLDIGLLIRFLVFYPIKISFVKPEACAIIFNTASSVNKFIKQRNEKPILTKKWNFEIFGIDEVV